MELTVYRQSSKTRTDGTIVYKGEDARPYVDGQIIFVADGLGGAAAIRHQKILPELFESDTLMDALFAGVYEDYSNDTFVNYVKESFFELFAVKDCYTANINNIKKSGYFASRIVTAIILHEMLYNEKYSAKTIFETLSACETEEVRGDYLCALGQYFKELIQSKIKQIANNANLIYESSYSGLALLGSTICATVYLESEDSVEAIYLTAGDSRPYVWTEKNGLCQVLEDQEGKDGGMTNYIKANEDADFEIRCDYFRFEKPCVLFNASDGCFDSGRFISQLAFEKLIIDSALESEDTEKMSKYLTAFFLDYGRHDDSSTIAMKMFGYDGFDAFKESCRNRLNTLNAEYFEQMGDLLDADYVYEYEQCQSTFPAQLAGLKEKFRSEQAVIDYCTKEILEGKYPLYNEKIRAIDEKIAQENRKIGETTAEISRVVADNYIKFKSVFDRDESAWERFFSTSKVENFEQKYQQSAVDYIDRVHRYQNDFSETITALSELLENVNALGVPSSFDDYDEITFELLESCERSMNEIFVFFGGLRSKNLDVIRKLIANRQEYISRNEKLAEKHPEDISLICSMVLDGSLTTADMEILEPEKLKIDESLQAIAEAKENIQTLERDAKTQALCEAVEAYWNEKYVDIILAVIENPESEIGEELADEARTIINDFREKTDGVREKSELQSMLFAKYDEAYFMYIGGDSDDDSRI
ncbi:MAG: hypothetical protein J6A83_01150 [Clostridia bacterium]|nr:hypothetical protein [Clostridia bacterium]